MEGAKGQGTRIDAGSKANEVLRRYPGTEGVFLQHGPIFVTQPGRLYLRHRERAVGECAERSSLELDALLRRLNAEAEAITSEPGVRPRARRRAWPPEGPIGYTGSYVEMKNSGIETEPFVANLLAPIRK